MAESFTVRWGSGRNGAEDSESAALALAFAHIRDGDESVSVRRPDGTEIDHQALLVMMAGE